MDRLPPDFEESLEYVLENLMNQSESFMLVLRYLRRMTYREIGDYFGLTPDRIRQIIEKSRRRLHHPSRFRILMKGLSQADPLPPPRDSCPPLGMVLEAIPTPGLELSAKRRKYRQIQLAAGDSTYPTLILNGCEVQAGGKLKVLFADRRAIVTINFKSDVTGHARWYISTPGYSRISPIGLFVEV